MMTRPRTSYAAFCYNHDDCYTFREFLEYSGVELPKVKISGSYREGWLYQYSKPWVEGEWLPTKKAAKASYKAILKAKRDQAEIERQEWQAVGRSINDTDYKTLRKALGARSSARPWEWLEINVFTAALETEDFETATRLVSLGLMDDLGPWKDGHFFQVSPNGCRALNIPEGRIGNARFL